MSKHWIKQDLIDNESKLNKLITNLDSNSRLCWLFMENHKYYISDSDTKLLTSLNKNKMPIKLINNSTLGVQISLKKYLYSTMVNLVQKESKNYVFVLINELQLKSKDLVDLKKIMPNFLNNNENLQDASSDQLSENQKNDDNNDLSDLINLMAPTSSLKNCTLEINEENLNRSDDIMLNLNDAFNKNSDFDFVNKNMTEDKTASFLQANNESVIKSSHLTNNHMSKFESQSISPIHTKTNTISEEESSLLNEEVCTNHLLNGLKMFPNSRQSRCSSLDCMSDSLSVVSSDSNGKRKRKLMSKYSKVSDQFEYELNRMPDDQQRIMSSRSEFKNKHAQSSRSSSRSSTSTSNSCSSSTSSSMCDSTSSLTNIHSKSSIFAPKRMIEKNMLKSFSEQKKINKNRHIHNLFSPISNKKKIKISNLFESKSSTTYGSAQKEQTSSSLQKTNSNESDLRNRSVFDEYKSLNIESNTIKQRRKRLYDPLSHVIDETSFENNFDQQHVKSNNSVKVVQDTIFCSNNIRHQSNIGNETSINNANNLTNDKTNLTVNNESIPAGQNKVIEVTKSDASNSNIFELSKSNLTNKQEALMNFKFQTNPNSIQNYWKNLLETNQENFV